MAWTEDAYFIKRPSGPPMQGDIWTNLPQPFESSNLCTGVVITPRCDLTHDKTPVVNYLPIMSLNEFMLVQGGFRLVELEVRRGQEALQHAADLLGVIGVLDMGVPATEILKTLLEPRLREEKDPKARTRLEQAIANFEGCRKRIEELESCLQLSTLAGERLVRSVPAKTIYKYKADIARNTAGRFTLLATVCAAY